MSLRRILLVAYLAFWGGAIGVLGKWSLESFSPIQLIFYRVIGTLLIFGGLLAWRGKLLLSIGKIIIYFRHFCFLAISGVGAGMILGFIGLGATSATAYDLLFNLSGIFIILMSWWGFREKVGSRELGLLLLALIGAALIIFRSADLSQTHSIFGDALVLIASMGWAAYSVWGGKAFKENPELDPVTSLFCSFLLSALTLTPLIIFFEPIDYKLINAKAFLSATTLSVFGTAILFLLWFKFVGRATSAASAIVALSENVGGVIFPIVFLGESLTLRTSFGGAIIILALVLMEYQHSLGKKEARDESY